MKTIELIAETAKLVGDILLTIDSPLVSESLQKIEEIRELLETINEQ